MLLSIIHAVLVKGLIEAALMPLSIFFSFGVSYSRRFFFLPNLCRSLLVSPKK